MELICWVLILGLYTLFTLLLLGVCTYHVWGESASANPLQEKTEKEDAHDS